MQRTLHGAPLSPFVRKVMFVLKTMDAEYKLRPESPGSFSDDFLQISPLAKIPVLQEDEWTQPDSSVICQYLIETNDHSNLKDLIPQDPHARAQVRWLEKYADYELAPILTFTVFSRRTLRMLSGKEPHEDIAQDGVDNKAPKLLDYLENLLGNNTYFVGDTLTMADVAITTQFVNFMHGGELIDAQRWPKLSAYYQRMYQQETFQALIAREKQTLDKLLGDRHYNLSPC
ncbi:MAG TPA: glutathione S-transferase family protein [Oceanospirillaceae bacterium]|nr:glutathione S-transferase family protein [Oceanospirillaceae bacterium]